MMFQRTIKAMAAQSMRCIAFAHKQIADIGAGSCDRKLPEDGLTLLGMVDLKDPCHPWVRTAVDTCRRAGAAVKMITRGNLHTTRAIALECSILRADQDLNEAVIEVREFRSLTTEQRMTIVYRISMMARSSLFDKLLVVKSLKKKGCDSSAMGKFQLTMNVVALVINFITVVSSGDVPFTTVQLLWVNLILDTKSGNSRTSPNGKMYKRLFNDHVPVVLDFIVSSPDVCVPVVLDFIVDFARKPPRNYKLRDTGDYALVAQKAVDFDDELVLFFSEIALFEIRMQVIDLVEAAALATSKQAGGLSKRLPAPFAMEACVGY
ncbi:hypothetical protein ACLOJK_020288 [Asimina triloba]